jgi:hypothetical protein
MLVRVSGVVFFFDGGVTLRCVLLSLAFGVAALAVATLTVAALVFAFAPLASVALPILSLSVIDRVGVVVDAKRFTAAAGRIR